MKPLIALFAVATTLAACSEPTAPSRAPMSAASLSRDLLHRAKLAVKAPSSTVSQASRAWSLTKVGALDPATSNVTWTITATQGAAGTKKLVVTGKVTLKNTGTKVAPIGNVVVTLQHKPLFQWITLSSDVANATAGDAATSAKIVKWTNNSDDSDGVDDDDSEPGDRWNVTTMDENAASGPLAFTNAASLAPGATVTLSFTASYDNNVLNLPVGRKVRAQIYVTFGNAGLGLTSAANLDIDGNGAIGADEARVRTVSARLGQKVVPAATVVSTAVTLSDAVADLATTGTVSYTNPVFTLGATTGTVTAHVAGGASGGTISNCAHLTGTGTNLQACNTQVVSAESATSGAWKNGDVITYSQEEWGDPTSAAGVIMSAHYNAVFAGSFGVLEVGIPGTAGHSIQFTSAVGVSDYMPQFGAPTALTSDFLDPTNTTAGAFGSAVTTLALNIRFADAGFTLGTGARFGDLTLVALASQPLLTGRSIRDLLAIVNTALGGGSSPYSIPDLYVLLESVNHSFDAGVASAFAQEHLVPPAVPQFAWKYGDVITYSQQSWGNPTHAAGLLLVGGFGTLYASNFGELEVGVLGTGGNSILFTSAAAVLNYLPDIAPSAPLVSDLANPTTTPGGLFGSDVVALRLNVDFSSAGLLPGTAGFSFGDLTMRGFTTLPGLNGMSVRGFLNLASTLLGGGSGIYGIGELDTVLDDLNAAFEGGVASAFAREHLGPPVFAWKNGDAITYSQDSWGNPAHAGGLLLAASYGTVYAATGGELEVGILGTGGTSMLFTSSHNVSIFLPSVGPSSGLNTDELNPTSSIVGGRFGGDVVALRLNVDFSDAGLLNGTAGVRFGDLTLCGFATLPGLNGMSVRGFLNLTSALLGGGTGVHSMGELETPIEDLTGAFEAGVVSQFARDHLRIGSCP